MFGLTMSDTNDNIFDGTAVELLNYCTKAGVDKETV
jgi:hypothetical protein